jgi:hypothetical protein
MEAIVTVWVVIGAALVLIGALLRERSTDRMTGGHRATRDHGRDGFDASTTGQEFRAVKNKGKDKGESDPSINTSGDLADYLTKNSYLPAVKNRLFGPKEAPPWEQHERIDPSATSVTATPATQRPSKPTPEVLFGRQPRGRSSW